MKWMKKEKEHESVSLTLLIVMTLVISIKLLLSDMTIEGYKFSPFTASDWATIFIPVAGLYFGRKMRTHKKPPSEDCEGTSQSKGSDSGPVDRP